MTSCNPRILAVTNMYPTAQNPTLGIFVERQIKGLEDTGVEVDVLSVDRTSKGVAAYWDLSRQIKARVKHFRPHLVHAMYGGVMAYTTACAVEDLPTVVSFCGSDLLGELLSTTVRRFSANLGVIASHKAARRADGIVVKSRNLQHALPKDVDLSKVRIIPNGVDLSRFRPLDRDSCRRALDWSSDRFHVLFSSNAGDPGKRVALAQAAVKRLNDQGIPTEFHQLSGVSHEDVPLWINASNVLLLTSVTEGSPNIVKEALACDIPVVSLNVGDVSERIQGIEGCYLASADPNDLAAKLHAVHSGPSRIAGRREMEQLSLQLVAARIRNFYGELLQGSVDGRHRRAREKHTMTPLPAAKVSS